MDAFYNQIISAPVKIALIGSGCSVATEPTAENSHYYNITHVRKNMHTVVQYKTCAINNHLIEGLSFVYTNCTSLHLTLPPTLPPLCADLLCHLLHRAGKQSEVSLLLPDAAD